MRKASWAARQGAGSAHIAGTGSRYAAPARTGCLSSPGLIVPQPVSGTDVQLSQAPERPAPTRVAGKLKTVFLGSRSLRGNWPEAPSTIQEGRRWPR